MKYTQKVTSLTICFWIAILATTVAHGAIRFTARALKLPAATSWANQYGKPAGTTYVSFSSGFSIARAKIIAIHQKHINALLAKSGIVAVRALPVFLNTLIEVTERDDYETFLALVADAKSSSPDSLVCCTEVQLELQRMARIREPLTAGERVALAELTRFVNAITKDICARYNTVATYIDRR